MTFGKLEAPLTRVSVTETEYYAISDTIRTIDNLVTDRAITERAKINLQPTITHNIRAERTIFKRDVDMTVGKKTEDDVNTEIV